MVPVFLSGVNLENMLEDGGNFVLVELRRVGLRETFVQGVLNGEANLRTRLRLLTPIQDNDGCELGEKVLATFLTSSRSSRVSSGPGRVRMSKTVSSSSERFSERAAAPRPKGVRLNARSSF